MRPCAPLRITTLQWGVGVFCAAMGALILVAPHQFTPAVFAPLQRAFSPWGVGFVLAGAGLLTLATLAPTLRFVLPVHLWAAAMLSVLAVGFAGAGAWDATSSFLVLALGTAAAPLLAAMSPERRWLHGDVLSLVIGLASVLSGALLLILPDQFPDRLYGDIRPYLMGCGFAFVIGGMLLSLGHVDHIVPRGVNRWVQLVVAGTMLMFGALVAVAGHHWIGIAYYGGFGAALLLLSWRGARLQRFDPSSLHTRLALVLGATAAVPLLVLVPLYAHEEETQAVADQMSRQQALTGSLAQNVSDYVNLHHAAVMLLASQPSLLELDPDNQHLLLKNAKEAYPNLRGFGTVAANGDSLARSDDLQGTSWVGDVVFEQVRHTRQPAIGVRVSPVIHQPIFSLGAPVFDASGNFSGMVAASLESAQLALLLSRAEVGEGAIAYMVDTTGHIVAHPDPDLVASQADFSVSSPPVRALLHDPAAGGSLLVPDPRGDMLDSFAHVPDLGWGVVIERPSASALAPTRAKLDSLFGGLILMIAAAAGFGILTARRLSRPLAVLGAAVDGLATGDGSAPLPSGGLTEVVRLADAFAALRRQLITGTAEREEAEEALRRSEERHRLAIQATHDVLYDGDLVTETTVWSASTIDVFGWLPSEMNVSVAVWETGIHPDDLPGLRREMERAEEFGGMYAWEYRHRRKDGSYVDIMDRGQIVKDAGGEPIRIVGAVMDITERRAVEHMKDAFVSTVSHELRTPLNGIIAVSQLLLGTGLDAAQQEYAEIIHRSGQALHRLIDDVLTLARYKSGKIVVEEHALDVRLVLEDVTALLITPAQAKGLGIVANVDHAVPRRLRGDAGRLRQVLLNLAGNALKFTDTGHILIGARVDHTEGERVTVHFEVCDSGIGIEPSVQARLFQPFEQADTSSTTRYGGTGLGLAICRELVESMGGQIGLRSAAGDGSTFWFDLPLVRDGTVELVSRADLSGLRMLLTCDAPAQAAALGELVSAWSMLVTPVSSAAETSSLLDAAQAIGEPFDAVLIALDDASGTGARLAHSLKQQANQASRHLILVASPEEANTISTRAPGVPIIFLPVRSSQLFDTLADLIGTDTRHADTAADGLAAASGGGARILVVEDAPMNQLVARRALERLGYQPVIAESGRVAFDLLVEPGFAVVLMDCRMPDMDGFETTRRLRAREAANQHPRLPIIALTANAQEGDRISCLAAGMDDYLSKPLDLHELARTLLRWRTVPDASEDAPPAVPDIVDVAPSASVLDPEALDRVRELQAPGETDLLFEMIQAFLSAAPEHLAQATDAVARDDAHGLADAAHSLKSGAAYLGASELQQICLQLEAHGRSGMVAGSESLIAALHIAVARTRIALTRELAGLDMAA
jgi:PAS domain S-box-containing protein